MAEGKLELSNGCVYEGDVASSGTRVDGKPHGKGKYSSTYQDFEGEFVNGEKHGKGKHTVFNQSGNYLYTYEGDFLNGTQTGKGKYTSLDYEYEGDFVDGNETGKGKYKNYSGVFEGDFVGGYIVKGKFTGNNGDIYESNFANRFLRNGEGKFTSKDGKVEDGYWHDDDYMGAGAAGKLRMEEAIRAKEEEKNKPLSSYDEWMDQIKGDR